MQSPKTIITDKEKTIIIRHGGFKNFASVIDEFQLMRGREIDKIIVSGPQRSGTTICSEIIGHDTGFEVFKEEHIDIDNVVKLKNFVRSEGKKVLQAPGAFVYLDEVSAENILIVIMFRDLDEIYLSQARIKWNGEGNEIEKLHSKGFKDFRYPAEGKYLYYRRELWRKLHNVYELNYDDLSHHKLWVPKEKRENFGPRQTKP